MDKNYIIQDINKKEVNISILSVGAEEIKHMITILPRAERTALLKALAKELPSDTLEIGGVKKTITNESGKTLDEIVAEKVEAALAARLNTTAPAEKAATDAVEQINKVDKTRVEPMRQYSQEELDEWDERMARQYQDKFDTIIGITTC